MDIRHHPNEWLQGNETLGANTQEACVAWPSLPLLSREREARVSTLRYGDSVTIFAHDDEWALIAAEHDHYLGWAKREGLGEPIEANELVTTRFALLFERADIKSPVLATLPLGAGFACIAYEGDFLQTPSGFVHKHHAERAARAPAQWAQLCLGAPYLWGGGTADGIDCSGLVQLSYFMAGVELPRDSDQQEMRSIPISRSQLRANDLVFWKGHVGMMIDEEQMIHATAFAMQTIIEPLSETIARVGTPTRFGRI